MVITILTAKTNREMFEFTKKAIQFRKDHPVISRDLEPSKLGLPNMSVHTQEPYEEVTDETTYLGVMFAGNNPETTSEDIVYVGFNPHWEETEVKLPDLPDNYEWEQVTSTGTIEEVEVESEDEEVVEKIRFEPRSSALFIAKEI